MAALLCWTGCASAPDFKPRLKDIRPLPKFFLQEIVTRSQAAGLKLRIYKTGSVTVAGDVLSDLKSSNSRVRLDIPAFVLRHPTRGVVLFDAGLPAAAAMSGARQSANEFGEPFEPQAGLDLASQLEREGIGPGEVRWIILSHLHWDHVGRVDAFPNATVMVDRREWEAQKEMTANNSGPEQFDPAAMEPNIRLRLVDFSSAPAYGVFDHGLDLFSDGSMFLLELSGHTPGSMGLWVNLDAGPALLAGDASWILDNHQDLALPLRQSMHAPLQYWRKLNMLKQMQDAVPQLIIFPGHDLMPLKLQPRPDISLAP
ncbi:MAG TPA: hypothetical protein DEB40_13350 [Elusimicrobia bacterium]|nr:hypothetical protein [Elusimicrobiota bacterium]HBT62720.1 hypothetical protein [Elusimicrobiota bacterium]